MTDDNTSRLDSVPLINRDRLLTGIWVLIAGAFLTGILILELLAITHVSDEIIFLTPIFLGLSLIAFTWLYNHYRLPELPPLRRAIRTSLALAIIGMLIGGAAVGAAATTTDYLDLAEPPEPDNEVAIVGPMVTTNVSDCSNRTCDVRVEVIRWNAVKAIQVTHSQTDQTYLLTPETDTLSLNNVSRNSTEYHSNVIVLSLPFSSNQMSGEKTYVYIDDVDGETSRRLVSWSHYEENELIVNGSKPLEDD